MELKQQNDIMQRLRTAGVKRKFIYLFEKRENQHILHAGDGAKGRLSSGCEKRGHKRHSSPVLPHPPWSSFAYPFSSFAYTFSSPFFASLYPGLPYGCITSPAQVTPAIKTGKALLMQNPQLCRNFFIKCMKDKTAKYIWQTALKNGSYRQRFISGMILLTIILSFFNLFFQHIQKRDGTVLHDVLLANIPAVNVSIPLFLCIWSSAILIVVRVIKSPTIFLNFLWAFILLSLCRFITISLVALNPPDRLIPLVDPLSNAFYGKSFVTKDLFFSGHTATVLIIFLCLEKKADRIFVLTAGILVGIMVLFQHVHYTVDVIFAPFFAYLCYYTGCRIAGQKKIQNASPS